MVRFTAESPRAGTAAVLFAVAVTLVLLLDDYGAGEKPDGVLAVTLGVAWLVGGTVGGVVVVTVC